MLDESAPARCGRISYTNDLPVYAAFDLGALTFPGSLREGVPADLNQALLAGELDISPVSSFFYLQHQAELTTLPQTCIGSRREVKSIYVISDRHPRLLAGEPVAVTRESATGRALFDAICRGFYGYTPQLVEDADPFASYRDARMPCLLIGDKAIDAAAAVGVGKAFDLGLLWHELTGKDMVYAIWAARNDFARTRPGDVAAVTVALAQAVAWGASHMSDVVARAQAVCPRPKGFYAAYYGALNYQLDARALEGLAVFARLAADVGLLPLRDGAAAAVSATEATR